MTKKSKDPCLTCDCWDSDAEGCTMPHSDKWYACPIESAKPENQKALEEMAAEWAEEQYYAHLEEVAGRKEDKHDERKGNGILKDCGKGYGGCL